MPGFPAHSLALHALRAGRTMLKRGGAAAKRICANYYSTVPAPGTQFQPKRALILTKLSRYEFEKHRHSKLSEEELERLLRKRGSDYSILRYHHFVHKDCETKVKSTLQEHGIETRVVDRFDYTKENIDWADVIFSTGGDGTFLLAACRIPDNQKPVIGVNTDPTRSEGHLCLPKKYSVNVKEAIDKLSKGKFRWTFRKRLRVTLMGDNVFDPPIELHDQQLLYPEYRFFDCLQEQHKSVQFDPREDFTQKRVLPVLALNEVYIGECLSARVSYYELSIDNSEKTKTKSSGLCVSSGTGSTSWTFNINKLTNQSVEELLRIVKEETGYPLNADDRVLVDRITSRFNNHLIFGPEENLMVYTIRDPISTTTLPYPRELRPRGLARKIEVKSRCFDACLVIDGGLSFKFNDGTTAILEIYDADALRTVTLMEP